MVVRPQQFPFYQPQGVPCAASVAETGPKPTPAGEPSALAGTSRGSDTRIHSAASSLIMEGKEIPVKSEPLPKPPASAPPSILVKPENSRNGSEKVGGDDGRGAGSLDPPRKTAEFPLLRFEGAGDQNHSLKRSLTTPHILTPPPPSLDVGLSAPRILYTSFLQGPEVMWKKNTWPWHQTQS